jgi:hypothetical protein
MSGSGSSSSTVVVPTTGTTEQDIWLLQVLGIARGAERALETASGGATASRLDFLDFVELSRLNGGGGATPPAGEALLIEALYGAGKPRGGMLEQLSRLYQNSLLDRSFKEQRTQDKFAAATNVASVVPDLGKLFAGGGVDREAWEVLMEEDGAVVALLGGGHKAQAKALGIDALPLNAYKQPTGNDGPSCGVFLHKTGAIHINLHRDAVVKVKEVFVTILHERFRAAQCGLIDKLTECLGIGGWISSGSKAGVRRNARIRNGRIPLRTYCGLSDNGPSAADPCC